MKRIIVAVAMLALLAPGAVAEELNAWKLLEAGIAAHQKGDDHRAVACLEGALRKDKRCEDAYYWLGVVFRKQGDVRRAKGMFGKVTDKYPTYALAQGELGHIALRAGDKEAAVKCFEACAKARPSADSWMQLAAVQLDLKQFDSAAKSLAEADKLTKENYRLVELWARLYMEKKEFAKAVDKYDALVKKFPRDVVPLHLRGLCHLELERPEDAARDFQAVLKLDPFHVGSIQQLLRLWKDDLEHRGDVSDLEKRLEMIKKNPPRVRRVSGGPR